MKQLAIIGPTASGKSDLAIACAKKNNACILSIDSLSIYKEIDIVSAKPSKEELSSVPHFGINEIYPHEHFSVEIFIHLYQKTLSTCKAEGKNLIIVGGTSFYLKTLFEGISPLPEITDKTKQTVEEKLSNLRECHRFLSQKDPLYMQKIAPSDRYRIEKALLIYEASQTPPSEWFDTHPPKPIIQEHLEIYNIDVSREVLRERIIKRTQKMYENGLIDEVAYLEQKYGREPNAMGAIGIVEVLEYLDAKISKEVMLEYICTHTAQLAKRQQTFNRTQFDTLTTAPLEVLYEKLA